VRKRSALTTRLLARKVGSLYRGPQRINSICRFPGGSFDAWVDAKLSRSTVANKGWEGGTEIPPLLGAEAFDPKSIDEIACADGRRKTDSASEEHKENG
jgi:hypothetical protein